MLLILYAYYSCCSNKNYFKLYLKYTEKSKLNDQKSSKVEFPNLVFAFFLFFVNSINQLHIYSFAKRLFGKNFSRRIHRYTDCRIKFHCRLSATVSGNWIFTFELQAESARNFKFNYSFPFFFSLTLRRNLLYHH